MEQESNIIKEGELKPLLPVERKPYAVPRDLHAANTLEAEIREVLDRFNNRFPDLHPSVSIATRHAEVNGELHAVGHTVHVTVRPNRG